MATTITVTAPPPGTPIAPTQVFAGTYTLDNAPLDHILCRVVYPAPSMVDPLVYEKNADHAAGGTWDVPFPALPQGLDACFQAELYVQGSPNRQDSDTIEDLDILNAPAANPIGSIGVIAPLPLP